VRRSALPEPIHPRARTFALGFITYVVSVQQYVRLDKNLSPLMRLFSSSSLGRVELYVELLPLLIRLPVLVRCPHFAV
jgi:hypothetical protein